MKSLVLAVLFAAIHPPITPAAETNSHDLERIVLFLTADSTGTVDKAESELKEGGFTDRDVWAIVETAIEKKDKSLLNGAFQAFVITGFTNEELRSNLRKLFREEKLRIDTLREWHEIIPTLEDPNDVNARRNLSFEVEFRHWIIHAATNFLAAELDEERDVHPYLRPEWHAIMLDALRWVEKYGTRKSIPVLETILSKEPKNFSVGGIADNATRALRAVSERVATK